MSDSVDDHDAVGLVEEEAAQSSEIENDEEQTHDIGVSSARQC